MSGAAISPADVGAPAPGAYSPADVAAPGSPGAAPSSVTGTYSPADVGAGMPPGARADGKQTGMLSNLWAGVHEGVANLASISDYSPWRLALRLAGLDPTQTQSEKILASPQVANVEPEEGTMQGPARAVTRGAVSALGPAMVEKALPEAAGVAGGLLRAPLVGGAAEAAGSALADVLPDDYKDVGHAFGVLVGGVGAHGAESVVRFGNRPVVEAYRTLFPGKAETVTNPETGQPFYKVGTVDPNTGVGEPIVATPRAQGQAQQRVATAMGQPPEQAAASIDRSQMWSAPIPDYQPTVGQTTGNTGALALEHQLRGETNANGQQPARTLFEQQETANQRALAANLANAAPADVETKAGEFFRSVLDAEQRAAEGLNTSAQAGAQAAREAAGIEGAAPSLQEVGTAQREAFQAGRAPEKTLAQNMQQALDPDGTWAYDTTPVWDAQRKITAELGKGGKLTPPEESVMEAAKDFRGVNLHSDLRSLSGNIAEMLREVRRSPQYGAGSPAYRRLSILMDAVKQSQSEAAARHVAQDAAAGGHILSDLEKVAGASGGENNRGLSGEVPAGATVAGAPASGAEAPGGVSGQSGAGGNRSVAGVAPASGARGAPGQVEPAFYGGGGKPADINRRIAELGGVKPNSDMLGYDLDKVHFGRQGRAVNPNGLEPDKMREILAQPHEGYLRPGEDIDAMVQKMHQSRTPGQEVYPEHYEAQVRAQQALDREARQTGQARADAFDEIRDAQIELGVRLSDQELEHAVALRMQRDADGAQLHPEEAIIQATQAGTAEELDRTAQRGAFGRPGVSPLSEQSAMELADGRRLVENLTPGDAQQITQANKTYAQYKDRWGTGPIGEALQSGSGPGGYRFGAGELPAKFWRGGPKGAEAADQLIRNFGPERAQEIIGDAASLAYRNAVLRDGVVSKAGHEGFMRKFAPILEKFPELADKFASARTAQQTAENAAIEGKLRIRQYENSAAKPYLGKTEAGASPLQAMRTLMNSDNAPEQARQMMKLAQQDRNQAAVAGIQRNFIDYLMDRYRSGEELGNDGRPVALANSAFKKGIGETKVRQVMDAILSPEQRARVQQTAAEMDRMAQSVRAVRIKGSPGSAADKHALEAHENPSAFFQGWLGEKGGDIAAGLLHVANPFLHAVIEGAGTVGALMYHGRRAAGLQSATQVATEMMANPKFAAVQLRRAFADPKSPLARQWMSRVVATGAALSAGHGKEQEAQ